jgi:hypothetical protein
MSSLMPHGGVIEQSMGCACQKVNLPADRHTPSHDLNAVHAVDLCTGWQMREVSSARLRQAEENV